MRVVFLVFVVAYVARTLAEGVIQPRRKRAVAPDQRGLGTLALLLLGHGAAGVAVAIGLWRGPTPWLGLALGLAVLGAGYAGRVVSLRALGGRWSTSVAPDASSPLCQSGPYAVLRHPVYAFYLVEMIGMVVIRPGPFTLAATAIVLGAALARIPREERLLAEQFPADFPAYRARTRRLVPFLY
jgi:protein-S-isoprenylcysteine O-methyltransferase Ste14